MADRPSLDGQTLYFDAVSGRLLHESRLPPAAESRAVQAGLHVAPLHQPSLHGLYFSRA